jgi:hypothetical protein
MATKAHPITWYIARNWETYYASAVLSGIVGDIAHQASGGYHISIEDNRSTNYSVIRPDDKAPPGSWPRDLAAAIDMSMNPTDMATCSWRLWNIWNDKTDPRRIYLNGFNGWFNDGGPAKRYDYVTQGISESTPDHKWHVHAEERRRWVTWQVAADAILSGLRGETKEQYLSSTAPKGIYDMFAKFGDGEGTPDGNPAVATLQDELRACGADFSTVGGIDGKYGQGTADRMVQILGQEVAGDGKTYGWKQYRALHDKVYGGGSAVTLPDSVAVSGMLSGTMSGEVSGTLALNVK